MLLRFLPLLALVPIVVSAQQTQLPDAPGSLSSAAAPAAQQQAAQPQTAQSSAMPLPGSRPVAPALKPYISCKLPIGPELLQYTSLPEAPFTRPAQTLTGPRSIKLMDGLISAYAFPQSAPFANVKVELLPASTYATEKSDLISEFDAIHAKGEDTVRNPALKPTLNGFDMYGFDRKALDGKVLGIYLFFDNAHRVATTAYFLNGPAGQRKFATIAEYANLRDGFLNAYTVCVRRQLSGVLAKAAPAPAKKTAAKRR